MSNDRLAPRSHTTAGAVMSPSTADQVVAHGHYEAVCYGADGKEKWRESYDNLVTTVGKNKILDSFFGNVGPGAITMGLKGSGAVAATDTQGSHGGWSEVGGANAPTYSGTRKNVAFSGAAGGSKATSAVSTFTMQSQGTVAGSFINVGGSTAKDDTTGTLLSAGDFRQVRTVDVGDVINVSYSLTL